MYRALREQAQVLKAHLGLFMDFPGRGPSGSDEVQDLLQNPASPVSRN